MNLFYEPDIRNGRRYLNDEESKHALKVLRLKPGDIIHVIDGLGGLYSCRIIADRRNCEFQVLEHKQRPSRPFSIHIAIAPTKNQERMEWFVEKCVELGIEKINFLFTKNSERPRLRMDRIWKKAIGALKQSQNLWLPQIGEEQDFSRFVTGKDFEKQKFIAYVDEQHNHHLKDAAFRENSYLILIGPEGDFTKEEIQMCLQHQFIPVSLGPNRLRTETAGLAACMILNLANQGKEQA